jgi:hypothetical protein
MLQNRTLFGTIFQLDLPKHLQRLFRPIRNVSFIFAVLLGFFVPVVRRKCYSRNELTQFNPEVIVLVVLTSDAVSHNPIILGVVGLSQGSTFNIVQKMFRYAQGFF